MGWGVAKRKERSMIIGQWVNIHKIGSVNVEEVCYTK